MFWSTFLVWCQQGSKQVQYFNYIVNSLLGHIKWLIAIQYDGCKTKFVGEAWLSECLRPFQRDIEY